MNTKVIAIVAVVVLVAAAGGGAAAFLLKKSDDDKSHSLDGMYMNIGTSDVVTIYNKSTSSSANASSSGAVSKSTAALSSDVIGSLYKKNASGQFEPVKFFKNKESMTDGDGENVEWLSDYSLSIMEKCGKFLHLLYVNVEGPSYCYELLVNTETGKIYQVFEGYNYHTYNDGFTHLTGPYSGCAPLYYYCGMYKDMPLFYKDKEIPRQNWQFESICTADVQDDKLVITELFNKEQFEFVQDNVKVYKNNIIEFTDTSNSHESTYYMFSDGTFADVSSLKNGERQVCDGYLCRNVIKDSNGFVTSYGKYTTNKDNFETVNPTDAEKFRIASEEEYPNQIFRYKDGDNTVILRVYKMSDFEKITIKPDLTKEIEEWSMSREVKVSNYNDKGTPFPDHFKFSTRDNMMYFTSGSTWEKTNIGFNGNFMFVPDTNKFVAYDLTSGLSFNEGTIVLSDLTKISDMYYKDGHVIVTGVKSNGQTFYATFESDGTASELTSDVILKETVILPLN